MRTTIRIDDDLYREVKTRAATEGRTVGQVIEDAIRLHTSRPPQPVDLAPLPVFHGSGVMPGIDLADSAALRDAMEGDDLDALR